MPVLRGPGSTQVGGWTRGVFRAGAAIASCAVALGALAFGAAPACAQCLAPFALADRWDDVSAIPGYTGGARKVPDWRGDGVCDHETFTDSNGNGVYDPGEAFVDANANGRFDAEFYSPLLTGYVPDPVAGNALAPDGDQGRIFTLVPAGAGDETAGHYVFVAAGCNGTLLGAAERVTGADLRTVDRALRDAIASDPSAAWDVATNAVVGSADPPGASPRVLLVAFYDPRTPLAGAHGTVQATKVAALFIDTMVGKGSATARFTRVPAPGVAASSHAPAAAGVAPASAGGAPLPVTTHATWGEMKAGYR